MRKREGILIFIVVVVVLLFTSFFWRVWEREHKESLSGVEASGIIVSYGISTYSSGDGSWTIILPLFDMRGHIEKEFLKNLRFTNINEDENRQLNETVGIINVVEEGYLKNSTEMDIEGFKALKLNINSAHVRITDFKCLSTILTLREKGEEGSYWMFIQPNGNVTGVTIHLHITFQIKGREDWFLVFFRDFTREERGWIKINPYKFLGNKSPNYHLFYYYYTLKVRAEGNYTIYAPVPVNTVWTDDVLLSKIYTGGGINSVEIINISEEENITINSSVENGFKALVVRGRGSGVLSFLYPSKVPSPAISLPSLDPWKYWFYYEGDEESVAIKPIICREHYLMITLMWYPQFEILKPGWNVIEIKEAPVI